MKFKKLKIQLMAFACVGAMSIPTLMPLAETGDEIVLVPSENIEIGKDDSTNQGDKIELEENTDGTPGTDETGADGTGTDESKTDGTESGDTVSQPEKVIGVWIEDELGNSKYYIEDSLANGIYPSTDGKTYFFQDGVISTNLGIQEIQEKTYYFQEDHSIFTPKVAGICQLPDSNYYYCYADASLKTVTGPCFITIEGQDYYFNESSVPMKGWIYIDDETYYGDSSYALVTGAKKIKGNHYYFDTDGLMLTDSFITLDGVRYYYGSDGVRVTGMNQIKSNTYFFNKKGALVKKEWKKVDGQYYYFGANGAMKTSTFIKSNNNRYYLGKDGARVSGLQKIDGNQYYFRNKGVLVVKQDIKIDGVRYYADKTGKLTKQEGWVTRSGKTYFHDKDGNYAKGFKKINGSRYYFDSNGVLVEKQWIRVDDNRYHTDSDGKVVTGWNYFDGYKYYFKENGVLSQNLIKDLGPEWETCPMVIKVNRQMNCITFYAEDGERGYIIPIKSIICSVGLSSTPTITGNYTLYARNTYRWHKLGSPDMGGYSYGQYCTRISGGYLFHSILYTEPKYDTLKATSFNRLGSAASHGCIRLAVIDAKFIYDVVNRRDTKVTIYDSSVVGPFDKPTLPKISYYATMDPTDPLAQ